jgi:hypothetical protein
MIATTTGLDALLRDASAPLAQLQIRELPDGTEVEIEVAR